MTQTYYFLGNDIPFYFKTNKEGKIYVKTINTNFEWITLIDFLKQNTALTKEKLKEIKDEEQILKKLSGTKKDDYIIYELEKIGFLYQQKI
jgi:uncharacterized pyridoxamine 5'-phosphate oxidase family protein